MTNEEYIQNVIRTEASPEKVLERMKGFTQGEIKLFYCKMDEVIKTLNELDKWKKFIFYGKPLPEELGVKNKVFTRDYEPDIALNVQELRIFHGVIGLLTEGAELLEAIKKVWEGTPIDIHNIKEEIGDSEYYQGVIYDAINANPAEVMNTNIAKLKARYPEKFTEENAINRNLTEERKILEQ